MKRRDGFTLIEIMVALAVLAFSLATLMGVQALTVQKLMLADQMNIAAVLVRQKMLEVEEELRQDGFSRTISSDSGDFREAGFDLYEWDVEIEPVEITEDAEEQFVANIHGELFGEGTDGGEGSLTSSAAVSQYLPMIIAQVPHFINQVGERTRRITLVVSWESMLGPQTLTITEYFTVLDLEEAYPNGQEAGALPGGLGGGIQ
jgi:prepilin-type N-terminal cleavage/methylation domain-containing protein